MKTIIYMTSEFDKRCKKFAPVMAQIVNEHPDQVHQYNVIASPFISSNLELPKFLLMENGVEVSRIIGVDENTEARLREWLNG